jgi:predicted nucleic acid-binding protein
MKVVIDTNIVFISILSSTGKIGQILIYGRKQFEFYAPNLVKLEVKKHQDKLIQAGDLELEDFENTRDDIFSCINFISEEQIPYDYWHKAVPLVRDIDMDDIAFVVLSEYLDARLWTGDKRLIKGLSGKGFTRCFTTDDLFNSLQNMEFEL